MGHLRWFCTWHRGQFRTWKKSASRICTHKILQATLTVSRRLALIKTQSSKFKPWRAMPMSWSTFLSKWKRPQQKSNSSLTPSLRRKWRLLKPFSRKWTMVTAWVDIVVQKCREITLITSQLPSKEVIIDQTLIIASADHLKSLNYRHIRNDDLSSSHRIRHIHATQSFQIHWWWQTKSP